MILLSTERHDDACEAEFQHKPEIILDYNACKGIVYSILFRKFNQK